MRDTSMLEQAINMLKTAKSDQEVKSTLMLIDSEVSCMLMDMNYNNYIDDLKDEAINMYR